VTSHFVAVFNFNLLYRAGAMRLILLCCPFVFFIIKGLPGCVKAFFGPVSVARDMSGIVARDLSGL
jgi:hypothetical protein